MSCPTSSLSLSAAACPPAPSGMQQLLLQLMQFSENRIQYLCTREAVIPFLRIKSGQSARLHATLMMLLIMFQDGMGNLHLNQDGIRLEGVSEFLLPLYVNEIQSRRVSCSLCSSPTTRLLINTLWHWWWSRNNYHWLKRVWKALAWKDLSKAADKLVSISQCWGSDDQFINNKGQLPSELPTWRHFDVTFYICAWKGEITHSVRPLLLTSSSFPVILPTVHYQGLPSAGDG